MTTASHTKVVGLDKAIADIKKFQVIKREALRIAIKETAFDIERFAKQIVQVKTGRLKASIHVDLVGIALFMAEVGTDLPYAKRLEFGFMDTDSLGRRYNQAPRPYLLPAHRVGQARLLVRASNILKKPVKS